MATQPWLDPGLIAQGREPMHAIVHAPAIELDGTWRFQLLPRADAEPSGDWREIQVPGCWTMQDTFDLPHYTNVQMPFDGVPPDVPEANPTGIYERDFVLSAQDLSEGRSVLHVGAAESVLMVHLNGHPVGISKDSHLAAEFDISDLTHEGTGGADDGSVDAHLAACHFAWTDPAEPDGPPIHDATTRNGEEEAA